MHWNISTSEYPNSENTVIAFTSLKPWCHTVHVMLGGVMWDTVTFDGHHLMQWIVFSSAEWLIVVTDLCGELRVCFVNCPWSRDIYLVSKLCNHGKCFPICVACLWLRTSYALIRFTCKFTKPLNHLFLSSLHCGMPCSESWQMRIIRLWNYTAFLVLCKTHVRTY